MQHQRTPFGIAAAAAIVGYLLCVIIFAIFCPFNRTSGAADWWVYGMSAIVTAGGAMRAAAAHETKPPGTARTRPSRASPPASNAPSGFGRPSVR